MASYHIKWRSSAERDLRRLDKSSVPTVIERIEGLADDPFPPNSIKLKDRGGERRLRVGSVRILYEVDVQARTVIIGAVGGREHFYRKE
jgi:mRNA interferase RelE/StbE